VSDIIVVKPKLINDVLVNPGIGFTTFQRFNGDRLNEGKSWTEGFPIEYQEFTGSLENQDYPMTSIAYYRLYWRFLEPEEGVYNWALIDQALETARSRSQQLMFRVAPFGTREGSDVPDWFRAMVGESKKEELPYHNWRVNPEDPRYVKHFTALIRAMGERYDGHPDLDSVDLSIVGAWGEGGGSKFLTQSTREALVDAYADTFKKTPLMMLLTDERTNQYGLSRANVGFRVDCLGDMGGCWEGQGDWSHMIDYYPLQIIKSGMQDAWRKAPVSFEVCWVVQHWKDMGWDIDYIIDQSLKWHISTFNAKSSPIPKEWQPNVERWLKKMGYRLALRRFAYPETVRAGGTLAFESWWENLGVAPCYRPYRLAYRLVNERTSRVMPTDADIRTWLPGDHLHDSEIRIPADTPEGHYRIDTAILDPHSGQPVIRLAMEGRQPDGWYALGNIKVRRD
jgi:hypothetical protein